MHSVDFLIVGGGVAGLRAAIGLADAGRVLVLTKAEPAESNTGYAQGGIAAAVGADDTPSLHAADTLRAGDGLCDESAVETLVTNGPRFVLELLDWGARFERNADGRPALAREAAPGGSPERPWGFRAAWGFVGALQRLDPDQEVRLGAIALADMQIDDPRIVVKDDAAQGVLGQLRQVVDVGPAGGQHGIEGRRRAIHTPPLLRAHRQAAGERLRQWHENSPLLIDSAAAAAPIGLAQHRLVHLVDT